MSRERSPYRGRKRMQHLKKTSILVNGIPLPLDADETEAIEAARRILRGVRLLSKDTALSVYRRSVDARRRDNVFFVYTVKAEGSFDSALLEKHKTKFSVLDEEMPSPVYGSEIMSKVELDVLVVALRHL